MGSDEAHEDNPVFIVETRDQSILVAADVEDHPVVLVVVQLTPLKGTPKRVNVSLDEYLLAEIDTAASAAGTDRSSFLAAAARARIEAGTGQT